MSRFERIVGIALMVIAMIGCGDDESAGPEPAEITGTWNATEVEYVSIPPGTTVELIALGGTATLTLEASSTFHFVVTPASEAPQTTDGTWDLDGDTIEMTPQGMPFSWQFDVTFADDSLGLRGGHVEYDFDDDGTPEQAVLNLQLVR